MDPLTYLAHCLAWSVWWLLVGAVVTFVWCDLGSLISGRRRR